LKWHFKSLNTKETKELYEETINLPFTTREDKFNEIIRRLQDANEISNIQLQYLENKLLTKKRWAKCYIKNFFTVGVLQLLGWNPFIEF